MDLNKTIENLQKNRMTVYVAENKQEALKITKSLLPKGCVVTHGGSVTLQECGIREMIQNGEYRYLDRSVVADPREVYRKTFDADFYLSGANAVTENGELYNVDGNCNRISALSYGPKKVIFVVGQNKIVPSLQHAIERVKKIAAPKNTARLHCNTYCATHGQCISLSNPNASMTDGCNSPARICCNYLVMAQQRDPERVSVILVKEDLGY